MPWMKNDPSWVSKIKDPVDHTLQDPGKKVLCQRSQVQGQLWKGFEQGIGTWLLVLLVSFSLFPGAVTIEESLLCFLFFHFNWIIFYPVSWFRSTRQVLIASEKPALETETYVAAPAWSSIEMSPCLSWISLFSDNTVTSSSVVLSTSCRGSSGVNFVAKMLAKPCWIGIW